MQTNKFLCKYQNDFTLTLLTINVRGCNSELERKKQFTWMRDLEADIVFMQETHTEKNIENTWRVQWGYTIVFSHGSSNSKGVAILFKRALPVKIQHYECDTNGRWIFLTILVNGVKLNLMNIYAPNDKEEQKEFFTEIKNLLGMYHSTNIPLII